MLKGANKKIIVMPQWDMELLIQVPFIPLMQTWGLNNQLWNICQPSSNHGYTID